VKYEPGVLEAIGYDGEKQTQTTRVETTSKPVRLALTLERSHAPADRDDISIVTVSALDAKGRPVPTASDDVTLIIEGPGEIIGVGNGDPSSHAADRFVPRTFSRAISGWRSAPIASLPDSAPSIAELKNLQPTAIDASRDAVTIRQPGIAAFWTRLRVDRADLEFVQLAISIGRIDDHGWLYLNGQLLGESHDWRSSPQFSLNDRLHVGENDLVIIVKNDDGRGGLGRGIELIGHGDSPVWHRRLFNGLAQVLVRSNASGVRLRASASGCESALIDCPNPSRQISHQR